MFSFLDFQSQPDAMLEKEKWVDDTQQPKSFKGTARVRYA
jgi:hypothetical protein